MSISWPSLSDEQIENSATKFRLEALAALELEHSVEIPVEQIAELHLGYQLDFVDGIDGYPDDVIGGIDFDSKTILVNSSIESHLGRYSFTIAHEIGHHVLHKEKFYKQSKSESIMCRGGAQRPIEELQADRFAEALLMPKELIDNHYKKITKKRRFKVSNRYALAAEIIKSSGLSNVSVSAMVVRLNHLGLTDKNSRLKKYLKFFKSLYQSTK